MNMAHERLLVLALLSTVLLAGCAGGRPMMAAPLVYAVKNLPPFGALQPAVRTNTTDVLYVTDRAPAPRDDGMLDYGIERSMSVAYGSAVVRIGGDASWEELATDASKGVRRGTLELSLDSVTELERAPPTPVPLARVDGKAAPDPAAVAELQRVGEAFKSLVAERLAATPRKEAFVYVHGIQNSFAEAVYTIAELWHFLGREGVPIAYTWPAGHGGFFGYAYDRESGEFTTFHLKQFFRGLERVPGLERVHVIAHSRGADVATTALRELFIETWASGRDPRERFRIHNMVLAAPDLDLGVTLQRLVAEQFGLGVHRTTLYSSKNDQAIGLAMGLFGGLVRLGQVDESALAGQLKDAIPADPKLAIIEYVGHSSGDFGHNYFRTNPSVASDLVLTLRYDRDPGPEHGRPLLYRGGSSWEITDGYPGPPAR